ncbi:MAG: hypothetical protein KDD56_00130 [Bdellovibrionales bacterium]|nr:hypothetical protein [Bdellovibrionales bacterium]
MLKSQENIPLDIALSGLPYEELVIERAQMIEVLPTVQLKLCSAEDLIILKSFADRSRDWLDIESVIVRQGVRALNWDYIFEHLETLANLKEEPNLIVKLKKLKASHS